MQRRLTRAIRTPKYIWHDARNRAHIHYRAAALRCDQQRYKFLHHAHHAEEVGLEHVLDDRVNLKVCCCRDAGVASGSHVL